MEGLLGRPQVGREFFSRGPRQGVVLTHRTTTLSGLRGMLTVGTVGSQNAAALGVLSCLRLQACSLMLPALPACCCFAACVQSRASARLHPALRPVRAQPHGAQ